MLDKSYIDFYNEMGEKFPTMAELNTWTENDWRSNSVHFYGIFTDIAWEMIRWVEEGKEADAQRFLDFIDTYLHKGDMPVINPITIDFLATIMEAKRDTREKLKSMMRPETTRCYTMLLGGYQEFE